MKDAIAIGMASMMATLHVLRIQVNRGLVSPKEVDTVYSSILETLESMASPEVIAMVSAQLDKAIPEMREWAEKLWIGKGQTNPG